MDRLVTVLVRAKVGLVFFGGGGGVSREGGHVLVLVSGGGARGGGAREEGCKGKGDCKVGGGSRGNYQPPCQKKQV